MGKTTKCKNWKSFQLEVKTHCTSENSYWEKHQENNKHKISIGKDVEKLKICALLLGIWIEQPLWKLVVSQKFKHRSTTWPSNSTPKNILKWIESRDSKILVHWCFSSIIHNSQKMETIQILTGRWMEKQNVIYTYNEILFSYIK